MPEVACHALDLVFPVEIHGELNPKIKEGGITDLADGMNCAFWFWISIFPFSWCWSVWWGVTPFASLEG